MKMTQDQLNRLLAEEDGEDERMSQLIGLCREMMGALKEAQACLAAAAARPAAAPVVNVETKAPQVNVAPPTVNIAAPKMEMPPMPPAGAGHKPCGWTCSIVKRDKEGRAEMFRFDPMS